MMGIPLTWGDAPRWARVCFDPTTIMAISAVAAVAGTAVSAMAAENRGKTESNIANYNAQVSRNNAISTNQAAAVAADQQNQQHRRQIASGIAAAGASGVDPNSGSPLEVVADLAGQAKLDEELGLWQARERAKGYGNQATLDVYSGRAAASAGTLNAASSLLSGAGRVAGMYAPRPSR
jgi:hypothetical protein